MSSILTISARGLGRKQKPLFADFSIPLPPDFGDGGSLTLRELISRIVASEVEAFQTRQEQRRLTKVLFPAQMEEAAAKGKISSGGQVLDQKVDVADAIGAALQGFVDGLYLVVIDEVEQRDLDAQVYVKDGSRITFIRLTFLAGA